MSESETTPDQQTSQVISGTLPTQARSVFRITNSIFYLLGVIATIALVTTSIVFEWPVWIQSIFFGLLALVLVYSLVDFIWLQKWKQERFSYVVQPLEVRLHYGVLTTHDVLIPMTKVQYVHAKQGPLLRKFGLQTITIGTAAGSHDIYAIEAAFAQSLREQIAMYARIEEEEVV